MPQASLVQGISIDPMIISTTSSRMSRGLAHLKSLLVLVIGQTMDIGELVKGTILRIYALSSIL